MPTVPRNLNIQQRSGTDSDFANEIIYSHIYPDLMGYIRHGNGWVGADSGVWLLCSFTDTKGVGGIRVQFPPARDIRMPIDPSKPYGLGEINGLWSPNHFGGRPRGMHIVLAPMEVGVQFPGTTRSVFHADVPMDRWHESFYIKYTGIANFQYCFALRRHVLTNDVPEFYIPPRPKDDKPKHDDL